MKQSLYTYFEEELKYENSTIKRDEMLKCANSMKCVKCKNFKTKSYIN